MLLTKEKMIMTDTDVTVQFLSSVLGRETGETATFARTPLVDGLIANGHVRVIAEHPVGPNPVSAPLADMLTAAGMTGRTLTRELQRVAAVAEAAGVDERAVGIIWARTASTGKLFGADAAELFELGVPVYDALGDKAETIGQGEVTFRVFSDALASYRPAPTDG